MSEILITTLKNEARILLDKNPLAVPRLKRRTILEFFTQRIDQLEKEVAKEKEFVEWNKNKDDNE